MALTGCGGEGDAGGEEPEVVVAALGDSITAGSPLWDPDPATRAQIPTPDERSQFEYWADQELDGTSFRNCGVFGERTDEIALRLDECAEGADALIVQGGINDIAQGRPPGRAADDLEGMVREGKQLGLDVYLTTVLPWNNGFPTAREPIDELNRLIAGIGEREDVPVLDFYAELDDPEASGRMPSKLTIDGDHPSVLGYQRLGELVAAELTGPGKA